MEKKELIPSLLEKDGLEKGLPKRGGKYVSPAEKERKEIEAKLDKINSCHCNCNCDCNCNCNCNCDGCDCNC